MGAPARSRGLGRVHASYSRVEERFEPLAGFRFLVVGLEIERELVRGPFAGSAAGPAEPGRDPIGLR